MTNVDDGDDVEAIKAQKREQLKQQAGTDTASTAGSPTNPVYVSGADELDGLIQDNQVVLVDFYADWCGPCKMLEPIVEDIAASTAATVAKVDVDSNQALAGQYQVQGIPTLYLFADGEPVERLVGAQDGGTLEQLVTQYT